MKLDRTLISEIKKAIGNGSREAKFALLKRIDAAQKDLSTTDVRRTFNNCIRKHGRAVIAICVAATLDTRKQRIDYWGWQWAREVITLLPNMTDSNLERGHIDDGIHPTAICDYARELVKMTTEE